MSKLIKTRAEFQQLAELRLGEAKVLLDLGKWDGAYYLAGYAVELALKACIIKDLMSRDAFPERKFSDSCYVHDIAKLVVAANLEGALETAKIANSILLDNWATTRDWSEEKRYHRIDKTEAEALYSAIAHTESGVLQWIKTQW